MRVLVLCADIGEGHVTVARSLANSLSARPEVEAVGLRCDLDVLGERLGAFLTRGFDVHLDQIGWTYDLAYRVFFEMELPRRTAHLALAALGTRALRRTIAGFQADVVVTEYPVLSAALGQLRALGRMPVPVCSSISDPAGLHYWAHPGIDLHLLSWPESRAEVERIAGRGRAITVRPLVDARFLGPPPRERARAVLSLPREGPVAVVSGGGWGLGDLRGATEAVLRCVPDGTIVCLAGRNADVRARIAHRRLSSHQLRHGPRSRASARPRDGRVRRRRVGSGSRSATCGDRPCARARTRSSGARRRSAGCGGCRHRPRTLVPAHGRCGLEAAPGRPPSGQRAS